MKTLIKALNIALIMLLTSACAERDRAFFPSGAFELGQSKGALHNDLYTAYLKAASEVPLFGAKKVDRELYRFLWLRARHNPVVICLSVLNDDQALITLKVLDQGEANSAKLIRNDTWPLSKSAISQFRSVFERSRFFHESTLLDAPPSLDGSRWLVEASVGARYHVVSRWKPQTGAVREVGSALIELAIGDLTPIF